MVNVLSLLIATRFQHYLKWLNIGKSAIVADFNQRFRCQATVEGSDALDVIYVKREIVG